MDSHDKSRVSYICRSCQPFFLKSVKKEDEYRKAQIMFEKAQRCENPTSESDPVTDSKSPAGFDDSIQTSN